MELFRLFGKIAVDNTEANSAIDDTAGKAKDAEGKTGKSFGGIGKAAATVGRGIVGVGAAIGGAFIAVTEGTREYRTEMGKLETAFTTVGHSSESAKNTYTELNSILGDSGQATEAAQQLAMLTDNQQELDKMTHALTGVYATFGEALPAEGLAEAANHTAKVGEVQGSLADALEWSGISVESFNTDLARCNTEQERQALITDTLNGLYGEAATKYKEVNKDVIEAEKAQGRLTDAFAKVGGVLEPVMTLAKNALSGVIESSAPFVEMLAEKIPVGIDAVKNSFSVAVPYLQTAWQGLWSVLQTLWNTIGKPVFDFIQYAVKQLFSYWKTNIPAATAVWSDAFNIIKNLWNSVLKPVLTILGNYVKNTLLPIWKSAFDGIMKVAQTVFNGIIKLWNGSLKPILNGIIQFVSGVLTGNWSKAWSGIKDIVSGVFSGIKTVISTAISVIKTTFSAGLGVVKTTVSTIFENVRKTITDKIDKAKTAVGKAIDKIKGFFNFKWKLPELKLPKVSVSGKFGLDPPSFPKFGLKWNAQGGILTKPTIFGSVGNTLLGGGESGAEAIAPIDTLQKYVRVAVHEQNEELIYAINRLYDLLYIYIPQIADNSDKDIILNDGVLVGRLAPAMDRELGNITIKKNRGNI